MDLAAAVVLPLTVILELFALNDLVCFLTSVTDGADSITKDGSKLIMFCASWPALIAASFSFFTYKYIYACKKVIPKTLKQKILLADALNHHSELLARLSNWNFLRTIEMQSWKKIARKKNEDKFTD